MPARKSYPKPDLNVLAGVSEVEACAMMHPALRGRPVIHMQRKRTAGWSPQLIS